MVEGECQLNQISTNVDLMWDISFQLIVVQLEPPQMEEVSQLRWDVTMEYIVGNIECVEKRDIGDG